uniref:Beta-defensin 1 preproprotein n=1 Tax=Heterocephalus glaber TaxID=10181 RepID=A0A0P6JHQ5_HETGA
MELCNPAPHKYSLTPPPEASTGPAPREFSSSPASEPSCWPGRHEDPLPAAAHHLLPLLPHGPRGWSHKSWPPTRPLPMCEEWGILSLLCLPRVLQNCRHLLQWEGQVLHLSWSGWTEHRSQPKGFKYLF